MSKTNRVVACVAVVGAGLLLALPFRRPAERSRAAVGELQLHDEGAGPVAPVIAGPVTASVPAATRPATSQPAAPARLQPLARPLIGLPRPVTAPSMAASYGEATEPGHRRMPEAHAVARPRGSAPAPSAASRRPPPSGQSALERPATRSPVVRRHRIADGDSLPALAARYLGDRSRFMEIFAANRDVLRNPDVLPIGVELAIPAGDAPHR